jgi:hypothetical protein
MRDWNLIVQALDPAIPPDAAADAAVSLARMEADFRPLTASIPLETEPAFVALRRPEDTE